MTTPLVAYDIELLKAWYTHNVTEQGKLQVLESPPVADIDV